MDSNIVFSQHVKILDQTMRGMQRILYVGTDCDIQKYPALARKHWRCIFTTSRSARVSDFFSFEDRQIRAIWNKAAYDAEATKLDGGNPMLVFLNGVDGDEQSSDSIEAELHHVEERKALQDVLKRILRSGFVVELIMVGYNPDDKNELQPSDLAQIALNLEDKQIAIYGLNESQKNNRYISYLQNTGRISVFSDNLGEAFEQLDIARKAEEAQRAEEYPTLNFEDTAFSVYINEKIQTIGREYFADFQKYGRVLTLKEMSVPAINGMMQAEFFYKFLKHSPNVPQWYGYSKRNGFALARNYDEILYKTVVNSLETNSEKPVILEGQSGSGKSIALASLAYRVFQERKYPILFINNPDLIIGGNTPTGMSLDNMLKELRDIGGRVLVILDWSLYNLQRTNIVRKLSDTYKNRGQNVVFVASAIYTGKRKNNRLYQIIQTPVQLSEQEKNAFKQLMINKAKLQPDRVEKWMARYTEENGLLSMLYRMIYELRPQLEHGIHREITEALHDTKQELSALETPTIQQPLTALAEKLIAVGYKAGYERDSEQIREEQKKKIIAALEPFSKCLAVSALFKLRMPLTLAMKLMEIPSNCDNRHEYCETVFQAPWLYTAMDDDKYAPGEYFVSFRDPMDARIFINSLKMTYEDQMQVVAQIIMAIASEQDSYYREEVYFLEKLIRMVGPNSDNEEIHLNWMNSYGIGAPSVMEALRSLRCNYDILEPQLVAQEITYLREYYARTDSLLDKIKFTEEAVQIAREILEYESRGDERSYGWPQGIVDSITVESYFSEATLNKYYEEAVADTIETVAPKNIVLTPYAEKNKRLMDIISRQPENSYPYNALLASFLAAYQNSSDLQRMYSDLADILSLTDITDSMIPTVAQNEYYQQYKNKLLNRFNLQKAEQYFDKLLSMGSAVGVYMKAFSILRKAKVSFNEALTSREKKNAGESALNLLEDEHYQEIIQNHPGCQYLKLQLIWLLRNKAPLFEKERQLTYMSKKDWAQLYEICCSFRDNIFAQRLASHYRAPVYYVMALACAQQGEYDHAASLWSEVTEDDIFTTNRQRTLHILCNEAGEPLRFTGTFNRFGLADQRIYINEMNRQVFYRSLQNIGMSAAKGEASNLIIGASYRGFVAIGASQLNSRR